jgi:hypothetical protein
VDVLPLSGVKSLETYNGVVVNGPIANEPTSIEIGSCALPTTNH